MGEQDIKLNLLVDLAAAVLHTADSPVLYMVILNLFTPYFYSCARCTFSLWFSRDKKILLLKRKKGEKNMHLVCSKLNQAP